MENFVEKLRGAIFGVAIGDAMGGPVEGWPSDKILENYEQWDFTEFIPPSDWDGVSHYWKGNGRITDDTLMTEALINSYNNCLDHMDAYDYEEYLIPQIAEVKVWVSEYQKEMAILERLWWPEKQPYFQIAICNADPRSAGMGNCVNCGVAMYIMPVGAVNAGDPKGAY